MQDQDGQEPGLVRVERRGSVMVLVLARPPVNALNAALRRDLAAGLAQAAGDDTVDAVVLRALGKGFSAGADIGEFGARAVAPSLGDLCAQIEGFAKPIVVALHGAVLGGGLEVALAGHYRIAHAQSFLGLPEVNLGLVPGAGATQRLPRLIGAEAALRLMLGGAPIAAAEAMALGLVDRVVESGLPEAAVAMAREGLAVRQTARVMRGFRDMAAYQAAIAAARGAAQGSPLPARGRIIDCVEAAALLPMAQGLAVERAAFDDLVATPEAAGLRHAFFSERRALTLPQAVAEVAVDPVRTLGIWGADGAAADLAHQALTAGLRVVIGAPDRANLVAALEVIAARQELAVSQGRQSAETRDADWSRLVSTLSLQTLDGADLVMCLPPGDVALGVEGPLVGVIGAATAAHPVGVTVAAGRAALAEVSQAPGAPIAAVARMVGLARQLGWRAVLVGPGGPVELHLRAALVQAVAALEDEGQSGDLITAALAASGIGGGVLTTLPAMPRGGAAIVAVCLAALAAEGARMVADGRVRSPASVDAVALLAGIVPRWLGGPMFQADLRGLMVMRAELRRLAQKSAVFAPAPLFDDLIAEGRLFGSLT